MQHKHAWRTYAHILVWVPSHAHAFAHCAWSGCNTSRSGGERRRGPLWRGATPHAQTPAPPRDRRPLMRDCRGEP
eukprot:1479429-Prymnesium_polylepis.1